jgi:hypothetical protein
LGHGISPLVRDGWKELDAVPYGEPHIQAEKSNFVNAAETNKKGRTGLP